MNEIYLPNGETKTVHPPIPERPNALLTNMFYGGLEIEYEKNEATGRYRYDGQEWKMKRDPNTLERIFTNGGEMPYHEGRRNINWFSVAVIIMVIIMVIILIAGTIPK